MSNNRYIITGGPGSGKSTLIEYLENISYKCYKETSREIIKEQNNINGNLTPWKDLAGFGEACYLRMKCDLEEVNKEITFFDRGLPDIIAYLQFGKLEVPKKYFFEHKNYNNTVFICPPWSEIYINDAERPESFSHSEKMYEEIKIVYLSLNCTLVELPKLSVEKRVEYIEKHIFTNNY